MQDDMMRSERRSVQQADVALAQAMAQMEAAITALAPELADSCISASTPAELERLADIIRELPGDWG